MTKFKEKACSVCGGTYLPTGRCSKYCPACAPAAHKAVAKAAVHAWAVAKGVFKGTGSGSATGLGPANRMYRHGVNTFRRWARERKELLGACERCGVSLVDASKSHWAGHHKDHDRTNNTIDNLEVLCKRCHQIEHECHKAFEGLTTIPKGSRADNSSKRLAPETGDDIV